MTLLDVGIAAAAVYGLVTVLWVVSIGRSDVSIIDPFWPVGFAVVATSFAVTRGLESAAQATLLGMVWAWAMRLGAHLWLRGRGQPEDPRYAAFRVHYGVHRYWRVSYFQVFLLQGTLILVIAAPLMVAMAGAHRLGPLQLVGGALFLVGFAIEAVADHQLRVFRRTRTRRDAVLDTGLWAWCRHPNYFGDAVLWWGFWFYAADLQGGAWCVLAPALMTFLLVRVSGVTMLDAHLLREKPEYAAYVARTPAFIPRPPA